MAYDRASFVVLLEGLFIQLMFFTTVFPECCTYCNSETWISGDLIELLYKMQELPPAKRLEDEKSCFLCNNIGM